MKRIVTGRDGFGDRLTIVKRIFMNPVHAYGRMGLSAGLDLRAADPNAACGNRLSTHNDPGQGGLA